MKDQDYKTLTSLDREVLEARDSPTWDDLSDADKIDILANRLHRADEGWAGLRSECHAARQSGWDCASRVADLESRRLEPYIIAWVALAIASVAAILASMALWGAA